MDELMNMIGSYGFPMVVATYLLVRIDKNLVALEGTIKELVVALNKRNL